MSVDRNTALNVWRDAFGNVEWATDCFGIWMNINAYSNKSVYMRRPGQSQNYDYSWNIDHIRPISDFSNESDADFLNNYEPMHRENNQEKRDNYPNFTIRNNQYQVVKTSGYYGYGIQDSNGNRIDWKARRGIHYQ